MYIVYMLVILFKEKMCQQLENSVEKESPHPRLQLLMKVVDIWEYFPPIVDP